MASKLFIFIVIVFITSTEGQYTHSNCGSGNHIQLKNLKIEPHPMLVPSVPKFNLNVDVSEDLVNPIQAAFTLKKKVLGFYVTAPCTDGVGSCTYSDWCEFCKTCDCPILKGNQDMIMPMNLTSSVPTGTYMVELKLTSATGQKGCITINNMQVN